MTSVGYFVLGAALVVFICVVCIKLALIIFILQMKKQLLIPSRWGVRISQTVDY